MNTTRAEEVRKNRRGARVLAMGMGAFGLLWGASSLQAETILQSQITDGSAGMVLGGTTDSNHLEIAVGLNTGSSTFLFDSMVAAIGNTDFTTTETIIGGIYSDASGNPGTLLASFTSIDIAAQTRSSPITLLTSTPITLAANTSYWFLLDAVTSAQVGANWSVPSVDGDPVATAPVTYLSTRYTSNSGTSWNHLAVSNVTFTINAVPEPSTWALLGLGAVVVGYSAVRRRQVG